MKDENIKNLRSLVFGEITVQSTYKRTPNGIYWVGKCSCGIEKWFRSAQLLSGKTKSCGHFKPNNYEIITGGNTSYVLVELNGGHWACCDLNDWFDKLISYKWCYGAHKTVSSITPKTKTHVYMHRLVLDLQNSDLEVDHINHDRTDNRKINLRLCTHSQNMLNVKRYKNNTSGYIGVSYDYSKKKWVAQLAIDGKNKCLGYYKTKEEAASVVDKNRVHHHKEFCGEMNMIENK